MRARLATALAASLSLTACMVGPTFTRPHIEAGATYAAAGDAPPPADQTLALGKSGARDWWTGFGSQALDGVVAKALADNPDIAAAKARVAEAEESVKAAQGAQLPNASLDATAGRQKYGASLFGPIDLQFPAFTYYTAGPSVSFPLDLFGGQRRTVEQQAAYAAYQRYELDEARLTLAANVTAQAFAIAATRSEIEAIEAALDSDHRNAVLVATAVDVGSATRAQLVEAQSQIAADEALLPPLHQQLSVARHALAILVGAAPADWTPPDFALDDFTLPGEVAASLPSELAHQRPDILAAEAQLHMASAAVGVATANLYPKIVLTGAYSQQALTPGGLFNASADAWSIAAGLTQPLFDGGQLKAERRAAVDRYQTALASYRKTVLGSFAEVADSLQAQANGADHLRAQAAAEAAARSTLDLARRSYELGGAGVFEVLDAQRRHAQAQMGFASAKAERLLATMRLEAALGGGGWPTRPPGGD